MFNSLVAQLREAKDAVDAKAALNNPNAVIAENQSAVTETSDDVTTPLGSITEIARTQAKKDKETVSKQSSGFKLYAIIGSVVAVIASVIAGFLPKLFNFNASGLGLGLGTFGAFLGALGLGSLAFKATDKMTGDVVEQAVEAPETASATASDKLLDALMVPNATTVNGMNLEASDKTVDAADIAAQEKLVEALKNKLDS